MYSSPALHQYSAPLQAALLRVRREPDLFREGFAVWLMENWHVYVAFARHANAVGSQRKHYSARTIMEVIRQETAVAEAGEVPFKINNNHTPDCARLFMLTHPQHSGLFEFRVRLAA